MNDYSDLIKSFHVVFISNLFKAKQCQVKNDNSKSNEINDHPLFYLNQGSK